MLGASGSGKTALLARWAADAVRTGRSMVVLDVHGDLGPAVLAALAPADRDRIVALDAGADGPVPGIDVLGGAGPGAAPRLVAALRRSSDSGGEVYWGFRLERIFDHFVRLVLAEGGSLADLYALLTEEPRREAARLATDDPAQARFLDELRPIVRRNPEFLWPAAARVAKVVLEPRVARVVAPPDGSIGVEPLLSEGRSLVLRLPMGALGPEGAQLAATLLLARLHLDRVARGPGRGGPVLLVVDEAQTVAPTLLAEILADGRKFGRTAVVATQFPGRLEGPLRDAAAGAASVHIALRTPRAGADEVGPWVGLSEGAAAAALAELTDGSTIRSGPGDERPQLRAPSPYLPSTDTSAWAAAVRATAAEFGGVGAEGTDLGVPASVLFHLRARELSDRPTDPSALADDTGLTASEVGIALDRLVRRGWARPGEDGRWSVAEPGRAALGELLESGAARESPEHRDLLAAAHRLFTAHGERLEILRQGRFDTRVPDALWRALSPVERSGPAAELLVHLTERRRGWAWRAFGGRDVYVEAEVSGAGRRERIHRDLVKADAAGAHCLFLVGDPARGRRLRAILRDRGVGRSEATVWVLGPRHRPMRGTGDPNPPEG